MAMITRNSLVLNTVTVVRDVVAGTLGLGVNPAYAQPSMTPFSSRLTMRHEPWLTQDHDADGDVASVARRAGRPACRGGVLGSRSPALSRGRISLVWSETARGSRWLASRRSGRSTAQPPAAASAALSQRSTAPSFTAKPAAKRMGAGRAGLKPAGGTHAASTRGNGA